MKNKLFAVIGSIKVDFLLNHYAKSADEIAQRVITANDISKIVATLHTGETVEFDNWDSLVQVKIQSITEQKDTA